MGPECFAKAARWKVPTPPDGSPSRDAGNYIARLAKRQHDAPECQAAIEALMLVVENGGPTMMAWVGIMRALYPGERAPTPRKKWARKHRIVS